MRVSRRRFGAGAVMDAQLYRREALAALAAAIGQNGTATLAGITVEKPVLPLATDLRWLILTFHKFNYRRPCAKNFV